ncbi:MAG: PAS domain-containing protein, partial [Proteobacteria bacterium]|nr:PAS domain-containing protein [Pseudomonadota bacterium]
MSTHLDAIDAGLMAVNRQGQITSFNRKAELLTGLARPAVLGRRCDEVFPDWGCQESCPLRKENLRAADCRRTVHLTLSGRNESGLLVKKTTAALTDPSGRIQGLTETLVEQSAPAESGQHQSRLILDSMADGVFATDAELRITFFNRAAEQITGLPRHQALGKPCREVFNSTLCDSGCPLGKAMQSGRPQVEQEAVFVRQDGRSVVPVSETATPLLGPDGSVRGAVGTFRALDLSRAVDAKAAKARHWEDFIGVSPRIKR